MNEWEEPIPVWIDSISIKIDEDLHDFMDTLCDHSMRLTPTSAPVTTKMDGVINFPGSDTIPQLLIDTSLDSELNEDCDSMHPNYDIKFEEVPSGKIKPFGTSVISPVKNAKPTQKPTRRLRHKIDVKPYSKDQRRKDKQRGYEKGYRSRIKTKREKDEAMWIQLETQIRNLLAKRTSVVTIEGPDKSKEELIEQRYLKLLKEEKALRESNALDRCVLADIQALKLYSGGTGPSRMIREQLNGLPSLRACHTFEFLW